MEPCSSRHLNLPLIRLRKLYERLSVFLAAVTIFDYPQRPTQPFIPPGPEDTTTKTYSYNPNINVPSEIILDAVVATIAIRPV